MPRIYREHNTPQEQKEQLVLYGVKIGEEECTWTAFHITGGCIGPYTNEQQVIQEAYDEWINNPSTFKPLRGRKSFKP